MLAVVPWVGETFTAHFVGRNDAGVALQSAEFEEPARRGAAAPERWPLAAVLRSHRFQDVFISSRIAA